ncbi:alpha/beta fold hydrolase [Roseiterribacter gracilis]|uniref:Alpha/beta hydrolase n=1 Tax=Roseiterribacter gracilis TaxID=2812848 RepID=A0A8S8XHQ2_9PROT|nr:alpha/beta hydrolase [Rhodospirillales bacterium TMPK1]
MTELRRVQTETLDLAYFEIGDGFPVVLLHGYPDDANTYKYVWPKLAELGFRVIVPHLRGHGQTRIRDGHARVGQQGAIAQDLFDLLDALSLQQVGLVGYDWGGRAACIAAALQPDRVKFLVAGHGYLIQDTLSAPAPSADQEIERAYWYQWYLCTARGAAGVQQNRKVMGRALWDEWSPPWVFSNEDFEECAASWDNPDYVDVVVHSYRHRNGEAASDPRYDALERALAEKPKIAVPTIVLHGADDRVSFARLTADHATFFTGPYERRVLPGVGHFLPREAPDAVVQAVLDLQSRA